MFASDVIPTHSALRDKPQIRCQSKKTRLPARISLPDSLKSKRAPATLMKLYEYFAN